MKKTSVKNQKKIKNVSKKDSVIKNPNKSFMYIKRIALFIVALGILSFNALVKVNIKAENNSESITVENLLKAHNEYRKEQGIAELKLNSLLNISSSRKGQVMIDNQCWSHYCPSGKSPWDFFDDAKYDYVYAGENLAEGYYTIDNVMQAWINSKTHRDNIVKPEFTEVGFSILYGNYLNNSNNVLVVVHFGSRSNADVMSAQNPILQITSPANNYQSDSESLDISGTINGLDKVNVFNNNVLNGEAQINGGIFTYRVPKLNNGNNTIWAEGSGTDTTLESNKINVIFNTADQNLTSTTFQLVSDSGNSLEITQETKNLINLVFIIFLAIIFLADVILVSRSKAITSQKSFSHYHLALILLVALIILIGGFAGQIQNGISV